MGIMTKEDKEKLYAIELTFGLDETSDDKLFEDNEIDAMKHLEGVEPTCKRTLAALDRSFWVGDNDELFDL